MRIPGGFSAVLVAGLVCACIFEFSQDFLCVISGTRGDVQSQEFASLLCGIEEPRVALFCRSARQLDSDACARLAYINWMILPDVAQPVDAETLKGWEGDIVASTDRNIRDAKLFESPPSSSQCNTRCVALC